LTLTNSSLLDSLKKNKS